MQAQRIGIRLCSLHNINFTSVIGRTIYSLRGFHSVPFRHHPKCHLVTIWLYNVHAGFNEAIGWGILPLGIEPACQIGGVFSHQFSVVNKDITLFFFNLLLICEQHEIRSFSAGIFHIPFACIDGIVIEFIREHQFPFGSF